MERKTIKARDQWVFRRDEWQCRMPVCLHPDDEGGRAIDPDLYRTVSPWAPTVDHVIPRSRGGTGIRDNLRAAHRKCNDAAQNHGFPELPVIRPARRQSRQPAQEQESAQ
jgi:5-methylcytosine-specific restriction endonuclease McrA